jgi:hypothetical protein
VVIQPSFDAFSPKNQDLNEATTRTILVQTGLVEGPPGSGPPIFVEGDGTPGMMAWCARMLRLDYPVYLSSPLRGGTRTNTCPCGDEIDDRVRGINAVERSVDQRA